MLPIAMRLRMMQCLHTRNENVGKNGLKAQEMTSQNMQYIIHSYANICG